MGAGHEVRGLESILAVRTEPTGQEGRDEPASDDAENTSDTASSWSAAARARPRPRILLTRKWQEEYDDYLTPTLDNCQEAFLRFVEAPSDDEKRSMAANVRPGVEYIVRQDALRHVFVRALDDSYLPPTLLSGAACFLTPFWIGTDWSWELLWIGALGLVVALAGLAVCAFPLAWLVDLAAGNVRASDSWMAYLGFTAALASAAWLVVARRPWGFEVYASALIALTVLWFTFFLLHMLYLLTQVLTRRLKLAHDPESEVVETLLAILYRTFLEPRDPDGRRSRLDEAAADLEYVSWVIDGRWRQLVPMYESDVVGAQLRRVMKQVAAGLRELAVRTAFTDPRCEGQLRSRLATELTAFASGDRGNLVVAQPDSDSARPRLSRMLRALGSLASALSPLALLLFVPSVLGLELDDKLFGTLITIALAWLAVHIVTWLDPKSNEHLKSMPGVTGMVKP